MKGPWETLCYLSHLPPSCWCFSSRSLSSACCFSSLVLSVVCFSEDLCYACRFRSLDVRLSGRKTEKWEEEMEKGERWYTVEWKKANLNDCFLSHCFDSKSPQIPLSSTCFSRQPPAACSEIITDNATVCYLPCAKQQTDTIRHWLVNTVERLKSSIFFSGRDVRWPETPLNQMTKQWTDAHNNLILLSNAHLFENKFYFVLVVWLGSGVKAAWLGLGKDQIFGLTWFCRRKHGWKF